MTAASDTPQAPGAGSVAAEREHGPEIELSVVMPCLNEAETLARCIDKAQRTMRALGVKGEVVIADNTVTDGSGGGLHVAGGDVVIEDCVFVDDLSFNLKPALQLGMATVLHKEASRTIAELEELLGVELG